MFGSARERIAQAEARVGKMLGGKYKIERVLGVGGMASVYEATHRNGRRVAVKVLHVATSLNADMRKRFLREGLAANAVNHPGVVVIIDDDVAEDGAAFLVMELLEGQVVERIWQRNGERLRPEIVLTIGYELCGVLEAAHQAGIIHRDIKPENLFLTRSGQLKVLDFGLARLRDQPKMTAVGMVFGTPAFMAPEQASGRASQVDARTDLWSVGATMFTLLSGETVHLGDTVQDLLLRAARKPARSLASVLPNADPRLVQLVDRALAVDKEARWPSAAAMRQAIGETCIALFGEGSLNLPSADDLLSVPAGSQLPTVEHLGAKDSSLEIADLKPSVDLSDSGATESDREGPRWSDRPTAELAADITEPNGVPAAGGLDAETIQQRVDPAPLPPAPVAPPPPAWSHAVGPPPPPNVWGVPPRPPSDPSVRSFAPASPATAPTVRRADADPLADARRFFASLSQPGGVGRALRTHPEALLLVIVGAAIVGSLVLLLVFATTRPRRTAPSETVPATQSARPSSKR